MDRIAILRRELSNIISKINSDNCDVRYSVYRTSLKLCQLQEIFHLHQISSSSILSCTKNYISKEEEFDHMVSSEVVTFKQLHQIVSDVLKSSGIQNFPENAKISKYLTLLIFDTFKDTKENTVALIAVVLFFVVLGKDELQTKYRQLFTLYAGTLGMLTRSRTGLLLAHMVHVTDVVGESGSFKKINPAVESCFEGVLGAMISMHHFLQWLFREPQSIVWLPTMHRLVLAKSSVHQIECATCKMRPIVGLRFQCLKCLDYDSCQTCFLTQKTAVRSHKLHHPRQEYCFPAGNKEKMNALARTIRNIVTKRYKHKNATSSFLPINQDGADFYHLEELSKSHRKQANNDDPDYMMSATKNLNESADFGEVSHLAAEEKANLEKLVKKLKKENKKISGTVHLLETSQNEKAKDGDEDRAMLQGQLDTVTLHNQSLKAELENLKCIVFADNFINPGPAPESYDDNSSLASTYVSNENVEDPSDLVFQAMHTSTPREPQLKTQRKSSRNQHKISSDVRESPEGSLPDANPTRLEKDLDSQDNSPENQLREVVDRLGAAMSKNLNSKIESLSPALLEICHSAEKVQEKLYSLIDQAVLI